MPIELKITAETVEEFDGLLARFHPGAGPARSVQQWGDKVVITDVAEVAPPLEPAPKKRAGKGQTAADIAGATAQTTATPAETATDARASAAPSEEPASGEPEEHPMLVSKTLADVKALGNKLVSDLGAGPVQALLLEQFKVKAFGALDPADFDAAYAALEALK